MKDSAKKNVFSWTGTLFLILGILLCILIAATSEAQEKFPKPVGAVNDFAGIIPADDKNRMEGLAREVFEKTGTAIVVATVESIGDNEINDYVNGLYQSWGIGKKGEDKGVLIFLTVKERKFRIETGYGVEGILPDGLLGEIRDRYAIPHLKRGDYGKGLLGAMTAVAYVVAKDANVSLTGEAPSDQGRTKKDRRGSGILPLIILILILIPLLGTRQGRDMIPWLLLLLMSGSGRGGGGSGGFGSFGGGGFGGFGGGSSGGGGAGGDF